MNWRKVWTCTLIGGAVILALMAGGVYNALEEVREERKALNLQLADFEGALFAIREEHEQKMASINADGMREMESMVADAEKRAAALRPPPDDICARSLAVQRVLVREFSPIPTCSAINPRDLATITEFSVYADGLKASDFAGMNNLERLVVGSYSETESMLTDLISSLPTLRDLTIVRYSLDSVFAVDYMAELPALQRLRLVRDGLETSAVTLHFGATGDHSVCLAYRVDTDTYPEGGPVLDAIDAAFGPTSAVFDNRLPVPKCAG